jgi:hypothetical protein
MTATMAVWQDEMDRYVINFAICFCFKDDPYSLLPAHSDAQVAIEANAKSVSEKPFPFGLHVVSGEERS